MDPNIVDQVNNIPTFTPAYLNVEYVFYQIFRVIGGFIAFILGLLGFRFGDDTTLGKMFGENILVLAQRWVSNYKLFVSIISVLAIALIIYCLVRLWEIRKEAKEKQIAMQVRVIENESFGHTLRWQNVLEHANSDSPSDWRLAILEADTMLESASQKLPVVADTLGERLKKIDKSTLRSLDSAWEAHKVRNRIAHEGLDFDITKRETLRVIGLFEQVLRELDAI